MGNHVCVNNKVKAKRRQTARLQLCNSMIRTFMPFLSHTLMHVCQCVYVVKDREQEGKYVPFLCSEEMRDLFYLCPMIYLHTAHNWVLCTLHSSWY